MPPAETSDSRKYVMTALSMDMLFTVHVPLLVKILDGDRFSVPGGAPPAEISNYTRMASEQDDMVSLRTRTRYQHGIRYDRPSRMGMSVMKR